MAKNFNFTHKKCRTPNKSVDVLDSKNWKIDR